MCVTSAMLLMKWNPFILSRSGRKCDPSMDKKRRKEPEGWAEREGESFVQRSQPRKARFESASTRRRFAQGFILCKDDGDEEEADISKDSERPE